MITCPVHGQYAPTGTAAECPQCQANMLLAIAQRREIGMRQPEPQAELERLRAEVEELRADAERYRWLRGRIPGSVYRIIGVIYSEGGQGIDGAIDAALDGKPTNPPDPLSSPEQRSA